MGSWGRCLAWREVREQGQYLCEGGRACMGGEGARVGPRLRGTRRRPQAGGEAARRIYDHTGSLETRLVG